VSGRRRNELKRAAGAMAFFLLGGTAAAALSLASRPQNPAIAATRPQVLVSTNRIEVSAPDLRRVMAAGLVDQPIKTVLNVPGRMRYGDFIWDERGIPAGRTSIRVDLKSQLISVFRSGHEIGTAVILYGADSVPTPTGKFPILAKLKDHRSATYDAPMPYTLRLTADGVSIHASDVRRGFATHGCIGVPRDFAMKLFAATSVGDEVFIVSRS
jgi:hypothetical protein